MSLSQESLQRRVYYSQNREDLILEAFFPDVTKGFYIDVGASDPEKYSVTKFFYDNGWNGINVEPIKHHYDALRLQRPRDTNLNIGIGQQEATLTFHEYTGGDGLSTFSSEMAEEYSAQKDFPFKDNKEYKVKVYTLKDVLKRQKVKHIHFLKVDVEGFEYDVLAGNDWSEFRPEVICIESNHITIDWRPLLKNNDYNLAFFDGLNEYYVDAKTDRQSKFDFVRTVVIGRDGGLRYEDYAAITQLQNTVDRLRDELQTVHDEAMKNATLHQQVSDESHRNYMRAAAAEHALRNPRAFFRYQAHRIHGKILRTLTPTIPRADYTAEQTAAREGDTQALAVATTDLERVKICQKIAAAELERLHAIQVTAQNHSSRPLRAYVGLVRAFQRLRSKKGAR